MRSIKLKTMIAFISGIAVAIWVADILQLKLEDLATLQGQLRLVAASVLAGFIYRLLR
jgi:hypothetical protein